MKRPSVVGGLLLLALSLAVVVLAAPRAVRAQGERPVIAQPEQDAAVRGLVQVIGTAVHPQFQRYELYYAPWPVPSDQSWIFIGDAHYQQQPLGLLGTWDSRAVPDGTYALRVRVVKQDGNYNDSDPRRVLVANTRPLPTPTSVEIETPTEEPAPLPPTATVMIQLPTMATITPQVTETGATPSATPRAESAPIIGPASAGSGESGGSGATELLNTTRLVEVARKTALYTIGTFVAIGVFFGVKAVLYWLWQRIRP